MEKAGVPVKISLTTKMNHYNGNSETFELIVFGRYYEKHNTSYLIYDEVLDQRGSIHTIVKFHDGQVQILRRGAVNMRISFQENEQLGGTYKTEMGTFKLKTNTHQLSFHWDDDTKTGNIKISYQFFMEEIEVGKYQLLFELKEENQ